MPALRSLSLLAAIVIDEVRLDGGTLLAHHVHVGEVWVVHGAGSHLRRGVGLGRSAGEWVTDRSRLAGTTTHAEI